VDLGEIENVPRELIKNNDHLRVAIICHVRYPLRSRFLSDDMTFIAGLSGLAGQCAAAEIAWRSGS
jgi:hypothetical protein